MPAQNDDSGSCIHQHKNMSKFFPKSEKSVIKFVDDTTTTPCIDNIKLKSNHLDTTCKSNDVCDMCEAFHNQDIKNFCINDAKQEYSSDKEPTKEQKQLQSSRVMHNQIEETSSPNIDITGINLFISKLLHCIFVVKRLFMTV